jgi:hypothetical protein
MAYVARKTMMWAASPDTSVVGYNVYWAIPPAFLDKANPLSNPNMQGVGNVTQVSLPVPAMPQVNGQMELGVAAVDDVGNISDIVSAVFQFRFLPPKPPGVPYLV